MKHIVKSCIFLFLAYLIPFYAHTWAYDNTDTHPLINRTALDESNVDKVLKNFLGVKNGKDEKFDNKNVSQWIALGGFEEDEPKNRCFKHFHDPLGSWENAGLDPNVWNDVGAVYLFERDGPQWTAPEAADPGEGEGEVQPEAPPSSGAFVKLTPSDGQDSDRFGGSVDLDGWHVIVGAPFDDDNGSYSGSAYIYPLFFVRISADPPFIQAG